MRTLNVNNYPLVEAELDWVQFDCSGEYCETSSPPRNMRLIAVAMLTWLLAAPPLALGQNAAASAACENAQNTAAMRACEIARLQRATESMDAAYQRLSARLDARGQAKLRAAQEAWLKFRAAEADCQADVARDGTLAPLIAASAQADLTEARGRDLDKAARQLK